MFLLLAIVCDDFFVPSIKKICDSKLYIIFIKKKRKNEIFLILILKIEEKL